MTENSCNSKNRSLARNCLVSIGLGAGLVSGLGGIGCTGTIPGAFRLAQQQQTFAAQIEVNTKIDLLWVVDNSSSMDVNQEKLRHGFTAFARKYMQPTWDIRVAVITTDAYLANPAFSTFLNTTINGTLGWASPYVNGRAVSFVNPASNPTLRNNSTGKFDLGIKFNDLVPSWGPSYSRLLPGLHDGPIAAFCFEGLPYFLNGVTHCGTRDNPSLYSGASHCLNPNTGAGESSLTQCVNTIENDTIHSGKAIIATMPSTPLKGADLDAWTQSLVDDFMINVTTGSAGHGSERGLGSVLQLIQDNELTATAFFRPGSLRGIIFVSDEDDQTMTIESNPAAGFQPFSHYRCDQASLVSLNGSGSITGTNGLCCDTAGNNCRYGSEGLSCAPKTIDGFTYTVSLCPDPSKLMPVTSVKSQLDSFFLALDGASATTPNYFVVSIVALTGSAIQSLQASRNADDAAVGTLKTVAVDRGDRYMELGNLVGNGSMAMNIADSDYSPILDAIGAAIVAKKSTFTLTRAPTNSENMVISVIHADGTKTIIPSSEYEIHDHSIVIDMDVVLGFAATDKININYEPKTMN